MADQHNTNIPALTNQISADIPDIKENLEFHKDAFQRLFETWSDTDNSSNDLDSTVPFNDGTYTYTIPTNNITANALFMIGDAATVGWFYASTVEGWKAQSSGGDRVLAVGYSGASYDSTDEGNMSSGGWTTIASHNHQWYDYKSGNHESYASNGTGLDINTAVDTDAGIIGTDASDSGRKLTVDYYTANADAGSSWRPTAAVGRLFKLDEA